MRAMLSSGFCTPARLSAVVRSIGWTSDFKIEAGEAGGEAMPRDTAWPWRLRRGVARGRRSSGRAEVLSRGRDGDAGVICAQPAVWAIHHDADDRSQACMWTIFLILSTMASWLRSNEIVASRFAGSSQDIVQRIW